MAERNRKRPLEPTDTNNPSLNAVNHALNNIDNKDLYIAAIKAVQDNFGLTKKELAYAAGEEGRRTIENHLNGRNMGWGKTRRKILENLQFRLEGRVVQIPWEQLSPEFLEKVVGQAYDTSKDSMKVLLSVLKLLTPERQMAIVKALHKTGHELSADGAKYRKKNARKWTKL